LGGGEKKQHASIHAKGSGRGTRAGVRYETKRPASGGCITWELQSARHAPGCMIMISPIHPDAPRQKPSTTRTSRTSRTSRTLQGPTESIAKRNQPVRGKNGEHDGHGLPEADRPGERRAAQDEGGEETQLDAVGLAVVDAVAAQAVWWKDGGLAGALLPQTRCQAAGEQKEMAHKEDRLPSPRSGWVRSWSARIRWLRRRPSAPRGRTRGIQGPAVVLAARTSCSCALERLYHFELRLKV
jgi:hypothetical protein